MSDFTFRDPLTGIIRFNDANVIHIGYEPSSEDITITAQDDESGTSKTITVNMSGGGGGAVLGQKTITENGTYDASDDSLDGYDQVTVNVPTSTGYSINDICNRNYSGDITITATVINACMGGSAITSVYAPNATSVMTSAFEGCTQLTSVFIGGNDATLGNYSVRSCSSLETLRIPYMKGTGNFGGYGLSGCTSLKLIDYGNVNNAQFNSLPTCPLDTIILRKTGSISTLGSAVALDNSTAFKNGGTGGIVYVPSDLISTYQSDTNWATYVSYGTLEFKALEGSAYADPDF